MEGRSEERKQGVRKETKNLEREAIK